MNKIEKVEFIKKGPCKRKKVVLLSEKFSTRIVFMWIISMCFWVWVEIAAYNEGRVVSALLRSVLQTITGSLLVCVIMFIYLKYVRAEDMMLLEIIKK